MCCDTLILSSCSFTLLPLDDVPNWSELSYSHTQRSISSSVEFPGLCVGMLVLTHLCVGQCLLNSGARPALLRGRV